MQLYAYTPHTQGNIRIQHVLYIYGPPTYCVYIHASLVIGSVWEWPSWFQDFFQKLKNCTHIHLYYTCGQAEVWLTDHDECATCTS